MLSLSTGVLSYFRKLRAIRQQRKYTYIYIYILTVQAIPGSFKITAYCFGFSFKAGIFTYMVSREILLFLSDFLRCLGHSVSRKTNIEQEVCYCGLMGVEEIFSVVLLIKLQKILSEVFNMELNNNTTNNISQFHTAITSGSDSATTCSSHGELKYRSPFQKIDINQRPLKTSTPVNRSIVEEATTLPDLSQIVELDVNLEVAQTPVVKLMEQPSMKRPNLDRMVDLVMHNTTPDTELKYNTVMKNVLAKKKSNNKAIRM
jgi:hypothetical protein